MKNLTKTNITPDLTANISHIEWLLKKQIETTHTFTDNCNPIVFPGQEHRVSLFNAFNKVNKSYVWDSKNQILTCYGRDRYARKITAKRFFLQIVGYKTKTTHLPEGFIYGNPIELK